MCPHIKGLLVSLAMLAGAAAGIALLSTAFEERDLHTQETDQRRN